MLLVFGSINLDLVVPVASWPRPGETVLGGALLTGPGGKGANQAHAAQRYLGTPRGPEGRVSLFGAVGADAFAEPALAGLRAAGVDLAGVRRETGCATGVALISVRGSGENSIVVAPGANARPQAAWVDDGLLAACGALLLQMELPPAESLALAQRAKRQGVPVLLNAAPWTAGEPLPAGVLDWLVVNEGELAQAAAGRGLGTGAPLHAEAPAAAVHLAGALGCGVLLTLGAHGALLADAGGVRAQAPALPVDVVDTTGAGDTCCGVFAAALAEGRPAAEALHRAVVAASLACTRWGAQSAQPLRAEIDAALGART